MNDRSFELSANSVYRGVNRAGPNAGRAEPGRARAERFLNSLAIRAGSSIL